MPDPVEPTATPEPTTPPAADPTPPPTDPAPRASAISGDEPAPVDPAAPPEPAPLGGDEYTPAAFAEALGEGFEVSEEQGTAFAELVNGATTKQELVDGLLDLYKQGTESTVAAVTQALQAATEETATAMRQEMESAPEFAGEKLAPALAEAKRIVSEYGGEDALKALTTTGFGNSLAALRLFTKIAAKLPAEPTPVHGGNPPDGRKPLADRMFPT